MRPLLYLLLGAMQALIIQDWVRVRRIQLREHQALLRAYDRDQENVVLSGQCERTLSTCRTLIEVQTRHIDRLVADSEAVRTCRPIGVATRLASAD